MTRRRIEIIWNAPDDDSDPRDLEIDATEAAYEVLDPDDLGLIDCSSSGPTDPCPKQPAEVADPTPTATRTITFWDEEAEGWISLRASEWSTPTRRAEVVIQVDGDTIPWDEAKTQLNL